MFLVFSAHFFPWTIPPTLVHRSFVVMPSPPQAHSPLSTTHNVEATKVARHELLRRIGYVNVRKPFTDPDFEVKVRLYNTPNTLENMQF